MNLAARWTFTVMIILVTTSFIEAFLKVIHKTNSEVIKLWSTSKNKENPTQEIATSKEYSFLGLEQKLAWQKIALSEPIEKVETFSLESLDLNNGNSLKSVSTLRGTYLINGLGSTAVGNRLVHPFEAHGFIKSIEFHGNGTITFRSKYVNTLLTSIERAVKRPVARGALSAVFDSSVGFLNMFTPQERNTANLACRSWPASSTSRTKAKQLIVGGDNSAPYCLDIHDLSTKGPLSKQKGFENLKNKKLLAHTRFDSTRQHLIMAACTFVVEKTEDDGAHVLLDFWEYDLDGNLVSENQYRTDTIMVHDWAITENYYVVPKNPAQFKWGDLLKFIGGYAQASDIFNLAESTNGAILLIPRHNQSEPVIEAPANSFFNMIHIGSTYEQEKQSQELIGVAEREVVVYGVVFDSYKFGKEFGFDVDLQEFDPISWSRSTSDDISPPRLDRFTIDCVTGQIKSRERIQLQSLYEGIQEDVPVDMPTFHPLCDGQKARFNYFIGGEEDGWFPFRKVVKTDLSLGITEIWDAGEGRCVSEPMFLPCGRGGFEWLGEEKEDDGFVVSIVHDANEDRCELAIFDAQKFAAGPIALLDLGDLFPWGVHGHWVPGDEE